MIYPGLSSDRLEYTLTNGLGACKKIWDIDKVKEIYENIEILENEHGIKELGFKDIKKAEEFTRVAIELGKEYQKNEVKLTMQFLADIVREMLEKKLLNKNDLYNLSEKEVIKQIENCGDKEIMQAFKIFRKCTQINESNKPVNGKYCVSIKAKKRYIVPLVKVGENTKRINKVSETVKKYIDDFLNLTSKKYVYLDFNW